jgi:hypothetical protein
MDAVPNESTAKAQIRGLSGVRYVMPYEAEVLMRDTFAAARAEIKALADSGIASGRLPPVDFLALSGGGDDRAFGAGLLCGWTAAGDRPQFRVVTGISTGALIAPFAFLGPKYDAVLRQFYTEVTADDILDPRSIVGALVGDAWRTTPRFGES